MHDNTQHLYNNLDLRKLLIPIIVEQLLSSLMGTADTMMVSNVGSAAISAVSLVDSINILVIQALSALSAGGAILCSQYLGSQNKKNANRSARQVLFVMVILSVTLSVFCLIFRDPLLHVIFGKVERDVMTNSRIYFFFTLLSFPFTELEHTVFNTGRNSDKQDFFNQIPVGADGKIIADTDRGIVIAQLPDNDDGTENT